MLTKSVFHIFINSYYDVYNKNISLNTFDLYLKNYDFSNEFHNCNINKIIGDIFEYIAKYYYIKQNYETYLFNEIPINIRKQLKLRTKDKGIDLIYKFNNDWHGVQCKWRSKINNCIDKNLIAGFITELKTTKINNGIVFTNVNLITKYINDDNIKWVTRPILTNIINKTFIDFIKDQTQNNKQITKVNKIKELRDYQKEAINKLYNCLDKNKQCIMFCGTGKSYIMI